MFQVSQKTIHFVDKSILHCLFFTLQGAIYPHRPKMPGRRKQYAEAQVIHGMKLFYEGHTIRGAARKVGIPESTLRLRLKQGKIYFRKIHLG